jgi:hypothetical protein
MRAAGVGASASRRETRCCDGLPGSAGAALVEHFNGPTAVAFSFGVLRLAKMLVSTARTNRSLRAAVVEGWGARPPRSRCVRSAAG